MADEIKPNGSNPEVTDPKINTVSVSPVVIPVGGVKLEMLYTIGMNILIRLDQNAAEQRKIEGILNDLNQKITPQNAAETPGNETQSREDKRKW